MYALTASTAIAHHTRHEWQHSCQAIFFSHKCYKKAWPQHVKLQVFERSLTSIIIYDFLYRIHYSPLDSGFFKGRWVRTVFLAIFHPADTAPYRFLLAVFTPYGSAVGSVAFPADQQFCKGIIAGIFAEFGFYLFLLFSIEDKKETNLPLKQVCLFLAEIERFELSRRYPDLHP